MLKFNTLSYSKYFYFRFEEYSLIEGIDVCHYVTYHQNLTPKFWLFYLKMKTIICDSISNIQLKMLSNFPLIIY